MSTSPDIAAPAHPDPVVLHYRTGEAALMEAVVAQRLGTWLRMLQRRVPFTHTIAQRLAWHLSPLLPQPGPYARPMLEACLANAHDWTHATLEDKGTQASDTETRRSHVQTAFIAGLFYPIPGLAELRIHCGREVWNPLQDGPLCTWAANRPVRFDEVEPAAYGERGFATPPQLRMALLAHLLNRKEMQVLQPIVPLIIDPSTEL